MSAYDINGNYLLNDLSVTDYGAKGDGTTDDTEALESAFADAYAKHLPLFFPSGTYLIRRSLTLHSGMIVHGSNATIKKKAAVTTTLTAQLTAGSSTMSVASSAGFAVGDQITISAYANTSMAARYCSVGYITAISGNTITFQSAYNNIKSGAIKNHASGCYVTNSFAIIRSWGMKYECIGACVHSLTLDGNRQNGEFSDWMNGCIHIDATSGTVEGIPYTYEAHDNTFRDLVIKNSPCDGVSDQSSGGGTIENCVISNCYNHGVHFGTSYKGATVLNNDISDCTNGAGVFWCQNVEDITVESNRITNCNKGCSDYEYGTSGQSSIIVGNVFDSIISYVFDFSLQTANFGGKIVISDNVIVNVNSRVVNIPYKNNIVFTGNIISDFVTVPTNLINITSCGTVIFALNIASGAGTIFTGTATKLINVNNSWN